MNSCECGKKAVISSKCKDCFVEYFEKRVVETINEHELLTKDQKVLVATSGGKDSLTVLYILHKNGYDVEALCVDEGVASYRDSTIKDLEKFCDIYGIKLKIVSFQKDFNTTLDTAVSKSKAVPCSICGVFRRYALNKYAKDYDAIVTGHNMDDEVQSVVMNYVQNKIDLLARLGPRSGISKDEKFTQRVKPLYFCLEKEIRAYTFIKGFDVKYTECPYSYRSLRYFISEKLNSLELKEPGIKRKIVDDFLRRLPKLKEKIVSQNIISSSNVLSCEMCGEPSKGRTCATCLILEKISKV